MSVSHILLFFYNWSFAVGAVVGLVGMRIYERQKAKRLDREDPLPGGCKHSISGYSRTWLAGLVTVATIGYVLLTAQSARDQTVALQLNQARCSEQFRDALKARADITNQDSDLSNRISDIRSDIDETTGNWINRLLNPPPEIALLSDEDPRKTSWKVDVTVVYFQRTKALREQIAKMADERKQLADWRQDHPLPDIKC